MPRVRNAFKIRAADAPIIETSQFLQLYCPLLLGQFKYDDLFSPKLKIVTGSPGSGKSSLLRLFETETLLALHAKRLQTSDQGLTDQLSELGILSENGPMIIGIYLQCDSSLRDIANLSFRGQDTTLRLFNALLDIRIIVSFLRSIQNISEDGFLKINNKCVLNPIPSGEAPPRIFAKSQTIEQMLELCTKIEHEFGNLLNSFSDDPLPSLLQPHARLYAFSYLILQLQSMSDISKIMPVVMLDDAQELYPNQRKHLHNELLRRTSIPRWVSVRTHVLDLEQLIYLEGAEPGRDYDIISLDDIFRKGGLFKKFAENVVHRRLQATDFLDQINVNDLKDMLQKPDNNVPGNVAQKALTKFRNRSSQFETANTITEKITQQINKCNRTDTSFKELLEIQNYLINLERIAGRRQLHLFPEMVIPEPLDTKTNEAARLFLTRNLRMPFFFGFNEIVKISSQNVQQLLSIMALIADRMIYRAELNRNQALFARDQENIFQLCAKDYYNTLEGKHSRGSAIKQFVTNLGQFCENVTYRPNAPIAPGVNGFALTIENLQRLKHELENKDLQILREVLTSAVAGNVFSFRSTKQGQSGSGEKIVFYLNRLLCIKFRLPLTYGGFQYLSLQLIVRMMQEPVPLREMVERNNKIETFLFEEEE